jgi:hypothetical protein
MLSVADIIYLICFKAKVSFNDDIALEEFLLIKSSGLIRKKFFKLTAF